MASICMDVGLQVGCIGSRSSHEVYEVAPRDQMFITTHDRFENVVIQEYNEHHRTGFKRRTDT
ncbi:hypothetical protein D3C76_880430 [compost metagenome]